MTAPERCEHRFQRVRRWPIRLRFRCVKCGFSTRRYDAADQWAMRPIHPRISVAVPGFNIVGGSR